MGLIILSKKVRLFVDPDLCSGCRICEVVCSLVKENGEVNPLKSRIRAIRTYYFNMAIACNLCEKAPCVQSCPRSGRAPVLNAINQDEKTGILAINEKICIRCHQCVEACPFGAINSHPEKGVVACDLCEGDPQCLKHCPTKAIKLMPVESFAFEKAREAARKLLLPAKKP